MARVSIGSTRGGGEPPRRLIPTMTTHVERPWIGPLWTTWYPMAPSRPPMAPTNWKSQSYPIYSVKTDLNAMYGNFERPSKPMGKGMI